MAARRARDSRRRYATAPKTRTLRVTPGFSVPGMPCPRLPSEARPGPWTKDRSRSHELAISSRCLDQLLRRNCQVRILDQPGDPAPAEIPVQAHAEPAQMADVGWDEVAIGLRRNQHPLDLRRRRAPDREAPVAVVVVMVRDEGPLAADEECRRPMAGPFASLGEGQADLSDPGQNTAAGWPRHALIVARGHVSPPVSRCLTPMRRLGRCRRRREAILQWPPGRPSPTKSRRATFARWQSRLSATEAMCWPCSRNPSAITGICSACCPWTASSLRRTSGISRPRT